LTEYSIATGGFLCGFQGNDCPNILRNDSILARVVKATTNYPAVFSAISFEDILDLLTEIKKEKAHALREAREELLSSWKSMIKKNSKNS
jgi:hypothetical protein